MRYINLTEKEKQVLELEYARHPKHYFRKRCHALLLSNDGVSVPEIASILKVRTRTIYEWMNRWEQRGTKGLYQRKGRGRKPLLSEKDESLVAKVKKKQKNVPVV